METTTKKRKVKKKKKSLGTKILLTFLALLLGVVIIGAGYLIGTLNKMQSGNINKENLNINKEELANYENANKITNIALFGVDSENGEAGRSDSIMVATIDPVHKKLKITSIMRDSYVNIEGYGDDKINHAYSFGGPELAINTINQNFGLNIEDYISVNFSTLPVLIDILGGIDVNVTDEELPLLNAFVNEINFEEGTNSPLLSYSGVNHLNGTQALAYSRIRYTGGGDFERTQRHRTVLDALFNKVASTSITQYPSILNEVLPYVETSLSSGEILSLGTKVLGIGNNLEQDRFPRDGYGYGESINGVYYLTFDRETIKTQMRDYIFNDIKE